MKILIQRVKKAKVDVDGQTVGSIGPGALVFFAAHKDDQPSQIPKLADKLVQLRIFSDSNDKMNLSLLDIKGEALIISQFTLYANCNEGRRPSFFDAAPPEKAQGLYETFIASVRKRVPVQTGIFGAMMQVELINDGPITILIEAEGLSQDSVTLAR